MSLIHDDFLLHNGVGRRLFHEVASQLPTVDYHNHLDPAMLADNRAFTDLTELWIKPDPYKHRAMRIHGIPERGITGEATNREKFENWAATVPATWGNPLYHWNALELKRHFGIDTVLTPATAGEIWDRATDQLGDERFRPLRILNDLGVTTVCTSDDLLSDVSRHRRATRQRMVDVYPSLRGDSIVDVTSSSFHGWMNDLTEATDLEITDLESYLAAVDRRLDDFATAGCVLADHALDSGFHFTEPSEQQAAQSFLAILHGEMPVEDWERNLRDYLLVALGRRYADRGWGLQLHVGAQRRTSARLRKLAGGAGGYASIGSPADITSIAALLDTIERGGGLPDIILYTLNPADNAAFGSLTGSFAEDGRPGKVQFGPAWWYNDQLSGIRDHLDTVASYGLLHHWIGMTTDSRSLLSFCRHEYFRRILCNLLGEWVQRERLPPDGPWLDMAVMNICYSNARRWLANKTPTHAH